MAARMVAAAHGSPFLEFQRNHNIPDEVARSPGSPWIVVGPGRRRRRRRERKQKRGCRHEVQRQRSQTCGACPPDKPNKRGERCERFNPPLLRGVALAETEQISRVPSRWDRWERGLD
ncbi:A disintegrin and metalloproteinase with thrombospondin motifs 7 [Dissostichus eleginoides]|uniref:A disintegrin and metalloproteinase with thrombospondin motifs 7 n=1 Tax=Dissostichus eleginoides TaxID=100907 RepID=A0AAD9CGN2_DISEL|nr:A disintegrin and metalloproteinase with thrombospondin motifs 7 [Dissostichus eleginoides]